MIKINLAKKKGGSKASAAPTLGDSLESVENSVESGDFEALRKIAIQRLIVILMGPLLLFAYQELTIPDLQTQLKKLNSRLIEAQDLNSKAQEAVSRIKEFKKRQDELQAQIVLLENLSRDRTREVKVLDLVQKDVPDSIWFQRLELAPLKVEIQGFAMADREVTQFMDILSRIYFFRDVTLVKTSDHTSKEFGRIKQFTVSTSMEKMQ